MEHSFQRGWNRTHSQSNKSLTKWKIKETFSLNVACLYVVVVVRAMSAIQDQAEPISRRCNCNFNPTVLLWKSVEVFLLT